MPSKGFRKFDIEAVRPLVLEGLTTDAIAARLHVSSATICDYRRELGLNLPTGRSETKPWRWFVCRACGSRRRTKRDSQVVCGKRCMLARLHAARWKLPSDGRTRRALLVRLYWREGKSSPEIARQLGMSHKGVLDAMRKLQIQRRPIGPRKLPHCIEPGCEKPVFRVKHNTNGSWYGRRCYLHWVVYRFNVNQPRETEYGSCQRRSRRLLSRVRRIAREVSNMLNAESRQEPILPT